MGRPVSAKLKRKSDTSAQALGAVMTDLRTKRGWGYEEVAHRVGCNAEYLNGIEHGHHNPSLKLLQAIADVHHVKLSKLFALAERKYERNRAGKGAKPKTKSS
jgi:transcriptional regulator with XRE-family HTH domain